MPIEETAQQRALRLKNLDRARSALDFINQERVKARSIFEALLPGQKKYLLQASGIHQSFGNINQLSDFEVEQLSKGLSRMKIICAAFSSCKEDDFKPKTHNQQVA